MAEQAVFTALQRGGSLAVDEAIYLLGVSEKLESAKKKLMRMQAFLGDLDDRKMRGGALARNVVSDVREVAHEMVDIIDTANILKRQSDAKISLRGAISKYACFPVYLTNLHKLGARIDLAHAKMNAIFEDFDKLRLTGTAITKEPPGQSYNAKDDIIQHWRSVHPESGQQVDVVGFDEQIQEIKGDLLDRDNKHLTVVSIVGPGGAGKSTLATTVYGLAEVKSYFEVHAWITVSQKVVPHDFLKEMVKILVPHHLLKDKIHEKEAIELDKVVTPHLLEESIKRVEAEKTNEDKELRLIPHLLEEMKHTPADDKAKDAQKIKELEKLVPRHSWEEVIKSIENKIKHAIEDWQKKANSKAGKEAAEKAAKEEANEEDKEAAIKDAREVAAEGVKDILKKFIKCIIEKKNVELEKMNKEEVVNFLHESPLSGRYLIVLDDTWSANAWDIIRLAFPNKKNGSRVILTTRNGDIAKHSNARTKIYSPKLLKEEESTRLLLSKAIPEHILDGSSNSTAEGQYLDELKKLGKDLAVKCRGLPLAIVVLGGHLSRHHDIVEWKRLTNDLDWHALITADMIIGAILDLSYYDMPSHLRSCFMYTTAFPEDFPIDARVLANLWVAEGFIPDVRNLSQENLALKCIAELAQRCMIQVEKRASSGRIKVIKVHDILRDWGIGRARGEGLIKDCLAEGDIDEPYSGEAEEAYRVVLHGFLARKSGALKRKHHTLLAFNFDSMQMDKSFKGWHHLRVLYLHSLGKRVVLPREIGQMRYLRYLGLGGNCIYYLPSSIGDLLSLETMYAAAPASIDHIPGSLWEIRTLKQVHVPYVIRLSVPRISSQSKVNVIVFSVSDRWNQPDNNGLTTHVADGKRIMEATKRKVSKNKNPKLSCCFGMRYGMNGMDIMGRCTSDRFHFPDAVPDFEEMHKITLMKICCDNLLNDHNMLLIGRMRHLKVLEIGERSYTGSVMTCPSGSFPHLQQLVLHDLAVEEWKMEHGSMTRFLKLTLCKCPNLSYLPEELSGLLLKLDLIAMPPGCHQGMVAHKLKRRHCEVLISSDEKDFQHLDISSLSS